MERQKQNTEKKQSIIINEIERNKNQQPKSMKARQNFSQNTERKKATPAATLQTEIL